MLSVWGSHEKSRESITRSLACSLAGRLTGHKISLHARSGPLGQLSLSLCCSYFYPSSPPLARRIARRHKDGLSGKPFLSSATLWILRTSCFCRGDEVWVFRYSCRRHVKREIGKEISFLKTRSPLGNLTLSNGDDDRDDDVFVWWWFSFLKSCIFTRCFLMHVSLPSSLKSGSYQY